MTLKLDRSDCARLMIACTALQHSLENEASNQETSADRRTIAQGSAEAWAQLHDRLRDQVDEFDRKQAERLRRLYAK